MLTKFREPVNGFTHLGGAVAALAGLIALLSASWGAPMKLISVIIYGLSLIAMFAASATYHLAVVSASTLSVLRKLDHSAIFLLIAGTYTPFCLVAFTGFWREGLLAIIWAIAAIGIVIKVIYVKSPRWLHTGTYIVMGWLCMMAAPQMPAVLPTSAITWLVIGGVFYTFGAVIYGTKIFDFVPGKFGFHEVWHIFVILGALAHFVSVTILIVQPR